MIDLNDDDDDEYEHVDHDDDQRLTSVAVRSAGSESLAVAAVKDTAATILMYSSCTCTPPTNDRPPHCHHPLVMHGLQDVAPGHLVRIQRHRERRERRERERKRESIRQRQCAYRPGVGEGLLDEAVKHRLAGVLDQLLRVVPRVDLHRTSRRPLAPRVSNTGAGRLDL
jgi:LmbE family N-acetylglucosaminyl deacetylase